MAKSKCKLCGKQLKSGEWELRATDEGVIKVCNKRDECQERMRNCSSLYKTPVIKSSINTRKGGEENGN